METDPTRAREIGRTHTKVYVGLPNYQNNLSTLGACRRPGPSMRLSR